MLDVAHAVGQPLGLFPVLKDTAAYVGVKPDQVGDGGMVRVSFECVRHPQDLGRDPIPFLWRLRHNTVFLLCLSGKDAIARNDLRAPMSSVPTQSGTSGPPAGEFK